MFKIVNLLNTTVIISKFHLRILSASSLFVLFPLMTNYYHNCDKSRR